MTRTYPYDTARNPPAPVLPLYVRPPGGLGGMLLTALVDTGADITLIPAAVAEALSLPVTGRIKITGATGTARYAPLHAAEIQLESFAELVEAAALGNEAILGRDLLNRWLLHLHGPRGELAIREADTAPQPEA